MQAVPRNLPMVFGRYAICSYYYVFLQLGKLPSNLRSVHVLVLVHQVIQCLWEAWSLVLFLHNCWRGLKVVDCFRMFVFRTFSGNVAWVLDVLDLWAS